MNNNTAHHQNIEAYLLGQLPPEAQALFEAAMQQDSALTETVELRRLEFEVAEAILADDIRAQMAALQAGDDEHKESPKSTTRKFPFGWAVFILLGLAALFVWINRGTPPSSTPMPPPAPAKPSQTPNLPVPSQQPQEPIPPPSTNRPALQARNQALRLYQRPDLGTFRGSESANDPLAEAIVAWDQNDYAKAGTYCAAIPADHPAYWRAQYIRAHAVFNQRRFAEAAALFSTISKSKVMPWAEESDWYGLLSLLAANQRQTPAFQALWQKIKDDTGHPYRVFLKKI